MSAITPKPFNEYTKGEQDFIVEMTRRMLVKWADHQLQFGSMPTDDGTGRGKLYLGVAEKKGWVSKDGSRVLASGFKVAAAFLRR